MNTWLYAYFIGSAVSLLILIVIVFWQRDDMAAMKELSEKLRDKLASIDSGLDKMNTAVDWWLGREGLKLEYMHANWRWIITGRENKSIYRTLEEMDRDKLEALARALYEANLQAMRDFKKEQTKKDKGGK